MRLVKYHLNEVTLVNNLNFEFKLLNRVTEFISSYVSKKVYIVFHTKRNV